jgi:TonB-dependent receptor
MENNNYTKVGLFTYDKNRKYDSRTYSIYATGTLPAHPQGSMDSIYKEYGNKLDFRPSYDPRDSYAATQSLTAFYLKQLFSFTHNFDLIASARMENSTQQLTDSSQTYAPLTTSDVFPSLGLTYRFYDDMQLRFAYAKTISRPDFREFSSGVYRDPITENDVFGNPNLKATYINHLDLKYEWYLSSDELFSIAIFAKEFTNPIEKVMKPNNTQGGVFLVTYQNAKSATSYGAELDYRKRFNFIDKSLNNFLFATNLSIIQSNIILNDNPNNSYTSRLTTKDRPMQGQSPYVVNLTFGYDNADSGDSALLLFNQIGKRIVSLGTDNNKDTYEQPFTKLDFVTKWKLNEKREDDLFGYSLGFKAENLLDSKKEFTQGSNVTASTKPGRYFSLKLDITY